VLNAFLIKPEDLVRRFSGYSDPFVRQLGLAEEHQFYPASPIQPPFLRLLNANEAGGLRLIRSLCNHAISFWRWNCAHAEPSRPVEPLPITLRFPWGPQTFWGDGQIYLWFRGTWGNRAVQSALMALEQWALTQCDKGAPFQEVFRKVIKGHESVAVLGISVSLCLAHPGTCLECALPLVTCPQLWGWDVSRLTQDRGIAVNEMGNWHRYRAQLEAVHKLNQRPHRRLELRNLLGYFVLSDDADLKERYVRAIRAFPDNLTLGYEGEKNNADHIRVLRERMTLFAEQGDPAYWTSAPSPDGKGIYVRSEPPSLAKEAYQAQQQEYTRLNDFMAVGVWAQKALDSGKVGDEITIDTGCRQSEGMVRPRSSGRPCRGGVPRSTLRWSDSRRHLSWRRDMRPILAAAQFSPGARACSTRWLWRHTDQIDGPAGERSSRSILSFLRSMVMRLCSHVAITLPIANSAAAARGRSA
jgi:hypothetical protein